jgi:putative membrane protein
MSDHYLWLKVVHVIAVISWMAGLLYLPRLFVYHAGVPAESEQSALFKVMERRLMRAITTPAAVMTWVMGVALAGEIGLAGNGWLHAKIGLVILMTAYHIFLERCRRAFDQDRNHHSARFYRVINEVPTLLMIGIVILVETKPF